jgi:deoxycytidylate deaminase
MAEIKLMSNKENKICLLASQLAKKSDMNQKHGAVIICDGEIIGTGYNSYCRDKKCHSIHAEVAAITNAMKEHDKKDFERSVLYVVRISKQNSTKNNCSKHNSSRHDSSKHDSSKHDSSRHDSSRHNLRMSKPCENCTNFIIKKKINTVYYSID